MITATADLVTAIGSGEVAPRAKVVADWGLNGLGSPSATQGRTLSVRDTFARLASSGMGAADITGGRWIDTGGSASDYAANGSAGTHNLGAVNSARHSGQGEFTDVDVTGVCSLPVLALTADIKLALTARDQGVNDRYIAHLQHNPDATMYLELAKVVGGVTTVLQVDTTTGLTHVAGTKYAVRLQVFGSSLRAKCWQVDAGEPDAWNIAVTDSALTAPGVAGFRSILQTGNTNTLPVVASWDEVTAVNLPLIRDLSDRIERLTIDRHLTPDSPDEVRTVEGSAAAQLTVDLAIGDETDEARAAAAWFFSPFNANSPMAGYQRHNVPIYAEIGAEVPAGVETLRRFTGSTIDRPVQARGGAGLAAFDGRDRLRKYVELPLALADEALLVKPGLNAQWVVDYVLRQNSVYASPALRSLPCLSATMHGSTFPEIGKTDGITSVYTFADDIDRPVPFEQGKFALAPRAQVGGDELIDIRWDLDLTHTISPNNGSTLFIEFWAYITPGASTINPLFGLADGLGFPDLKIVLTDLGSTTRVDLVHVRGITSTPTFTQQGPTISGGAGWRYIGVHVTFGTTVTTRFRVDSTTTEVATVDVAVVESPPFNAARFPGGIPFEALQVTAEAYNASMWNDAFVPTATLDPSTNELTAIPPGTAGDSWDLLTEVAAAEYATFGFDEADLFEYRNRARWVTTEAQTQQAQLTAVSSVVDLDIDDGISAVRNAITVPFAPVVVAASLGEVWAAVEKYQIPARSSLTIWANFDTAVADISGNWTFASNNINSWFEANTKPDGTGTDYTGGITATFEAIFANSAKIKFVNSNSSTRYLVDASGEPSVHIVGRSVTTPDTGSAAPIATDDGSIAKYRYRPLTVPDNRWRQTNSVAAGLAGDLLGELKVPRPTIKNLRIVGDPRLQLGDRVGVEVLGSVGLNGDYWITGCRDEFDRTAGYQQVLVVRQATVVLLWDVGRWDVNVWGA